MQKLAKFMLDPDAPNATSTLINGVSIIIDIIRHNNSDLENDPAVAALYDYQSTAVRAGGSVSLADMLRVMGDHVPEFTHLLLKPRSVNGPIRTTLGELEPLGFERLKICELFAELLHCSNMSNLNNFAMTPEEEAELEDKLPEENDAEGEQEQQEKDTKEEIDDKKTDEEAVKSEAEPELSVGDYLKSKFVDNRAMPICVVSEILCSVAMRETTTKQYALGPVFRVSLEQLFALCDLRHVASGLQRSHGCRT